jgi:hypothetical protein
MTTIMIESDDASNIQKILDFIKRLKGNTKVQIKDDENEILEAMHQMDKGIFHEISHEELFNLIHN